MSFKVGCYIVYYFHWPIAKYRSKNNNKFNNYYYCYNENNNFNNLLT